MLPPYQPHPLSKHPATITCCLDKVYSTLPQVNNLIVYKNVIVYYCITSIIVDFKLFLGAGMETVFCNIAFNLIEYKGSTVY